MNSNNPNQNMNCRKAKKRATQLAYRKRRIEITQKDPKLLTPSEKKTLNQYKNELKREKERKTRNRHHLNEAKTTNESQRTDLMKSILCRHKNLLKKRRESNKVKRKKLEVYKNTDPSIRTDEMNSIIQKNDTSLKKRRDRRRIKKFIESDTYEINCTQLSVVPGIDKNSLPLLPPDDQACLQRGNRVRIKHNDIKEAREAYNIGMGMISSKNNQRKYLYGSRYKNFFSGHVKVIDVLRDYGGKLDLNIGFNNKKKKSIMKIRNLGLESELMDVIKNFNRKCKKCSKARGESGDLGEMFAFGLHNKVDEYKSMESEDLDLLEHYSKVARKYLEKYFPEEIKDIIHADSKQGIKPSKAMGGTDGISAYALLSMDLRNAAHYDLDTSASITIFNEDLPGTATNWNFVLPNTILNDGKSDEAVVIKLFDGCAIGWDGREIFHCTSAKDIGENNHIYGNFWGGKKYDHSR